MLCLSSELSRRIQWAKQQPDAPLWPNGPTPNQYVDGFIRKPGGGSYAMARTTDGNYKSFDWMSEVHALFNCLQWTEVTSVIKCQPGCFKTGNRYWRGVLPKENYHLFKLFSNVKAVNELTDEELQDVRLRRGPHGLELFLDCLPEAAATVDYVMAITDNDGLVTWHPGQIASPTDLRFAVVKL